MFGDLRCMLNVDALAMSCHTQEPRVKTELASRNNRDSVF